MTEQFVDAEENFYKIKDEYKNSGLGCVVIN